MFVHGQQLMGWPANQRLEKMNFFCLEGKRKWMCCSGWAQRSWNRFHLEEALVGQVDKVTHSEDIGLFPPPSQGFLIGPVCK